jgi:hypothetical protein
VDLNDFYRRAGSQVGARADTKPASFEELSLHPYVREENSVEVKKDEKMSLMLSRSAR